MKWYEKQKQVYSQKNQSVETEKKQENPFTSPYVEQEEPVVSPTSTFEDEMRYHQASDEQEHVVYEDITDYSNDQLDEMLDDSTEAYAQPYVEPAYTNIVQDQINGEVTIVNKGTLITGNVEADGDLIIHGHIKGDILCNANLSIYGVVEGTINCNNAYFDNAIITGDVGCSGGLELTQSTTINGNVEAYEILNGGRIKGNATIAEGVRFLSTSAIVGNVNANSIEIERGAVIQGNITIRQDVYFDGN